jgi:Transposase DDE domain
MSTISQVKEILQRVLGSRADELARETHFVQRQRQLSGADFVQSLVFGYLHRPNATAENIIRFVQRRETDISEAGLCQRFTPEAAVFFERVMQELVQESIEAQQPAPIGLFTHFDAVVLEDSTTITLPDSMHRIWMGHGGGQGQSRAGLKLHVRWDLKHGGLQGPILTGSRMADQRSPLRQQGIPVGVLNSADQAYSSLEWLGSQEGFFITRPRAQTAFYDPETKEKVDLDQLCPTQVWQGWVLAGSRAPQLTRMIIVRVPDDVAEQRRERIIKEAKQRGKQANEEVLKRAQWTILITNAPEEILTLTDVLVLQRARWQIERLFRLWKEGGKIDEWRGRTPWRILCELYAKVMAMLIEHWFLVLGTWQDPYRSLVKAADVVREYVPELFMGLLDRADWQEVVAHLFKAMRKCRLHRRKHHPSHPQLLLEGLNWCLT